VAVRAVRAAPYDAGLGLLNWVRQPGVWHQLDGEYVGRGIDLLRLPLSRFLNVVYSVAIERLKHDEKQPERPRHDFDNTLGVRSWETPGGARLRAVVEGAPSWWDGDEEASQQFLASMGVVMDG
jgi:hypothetical protein